MNGRAEYLKKLVGELYERTNDGKLSWQTTSSSDRFVVLLRSGAVEISESEPRFDPATDEEEHSYHARLLDRDGRLIDHFTDQDFRDAPGEQIALSELYRVARASALNSDSVVQELLTELQTLGSG